MTKIFKLLFLNLFLCSLSIYSAENKFSVEASKLNLPMHFSRRQLGNNLAKLLGTIAFGNDEEILNANISFSKNNNFKKKELVVVKIFQDQQSYYVYGICVDKIDIPLHLKLEYKTGYIIQGLHSTNSFDVFSTRRIGKMIIN